MSDFLAEVDEAMRQEKMEKFWHENKSFIIAFIVLTIVLTGVFSGFRTWNESVKVKQTSALITMMEADDYPKNVLDAEGLEFRAPMRGITWLGAAGTFMAQDDVENAYTLYQRVVADDRIPDRFRSLAILMSVRIDSQKEGADAGQLLAALKPVMNSDNPWQAEAKVDAAVIHANLQGDYAMAQDLLNQVMDAQGLPDTVYERAQNLEHVYALRSASQAPAVETPSQ